MKKKKKSEKKLKNVTYHMGIRLPRHRDFPQHGYRVKAKIIRIPKSPQDAHGTAVATSPPTEAAAQAARSRTSPP